MDQHDCCTEHAGNPSREDELKNTPFIICEYAAATPLGWLMSSQREGTQYIALIRLCSFVTSEGSSSVSCHPSVCWRASDTVSILTEHQYGHSNWSALVLCNACNACMFGALMHRCTFHDVMLQGPLVCSSSVHMYSYSTLSNTNEMVMPDVALALILMRPPV